MKNAAPMPGAVRTLAMRPEKPINVVNPDAFEKLIGCLFNPRRCHEIPQE
jgi:hypothetical protein